MPEPTPNRQGAVYILECSDGSYDVGATAGGNMDARVAQHQAGFGSDWTKRRRPVRLVWADISGSFGGALAMEQQIKGWSRVKKEALIRGDWASVSNAGKKKDWRDYRERKAREKAY